MTDDVKTLSYYQLDRLIAATLAAGIATAEGKSTPRRVVDQYRDVLMILEREGIDATPRTE